MPIFWAISQVIDNMGLFSMHLQAYENIKEIVTAW
jgi:hypothetical protein